MKRVGNHCITEFLIPLKTLLKYCEDLPTYKNKISILCGVCSFCRYHVCTFLCTQIMCTLKLFENLFQVVRSLQTSGVTPLVRGSPILYCMTSCEKQRVDYGWSFRLIVLVKGTRIFKSLP